MKDYEERRTAAAKDDKGDPKAAKAGGKKPALADEGDKDGRDKPDAGEGMMAGVTPGAAKKDDQKKLLPVTPWGRYVKILLSSNEFIFVN